MKKALLRQFHLAPDEVGLDRKPLDQGFLVQQFLHHVLSVGILRVQIKLMRLLALQRHHLQALRDLRHRLQNHLVDHLKSNYQSHRLQ
jgi:hypothetical protein